LKSSQTHLDVLKTFGPVVRESNGKTKIFYNGDVSAEKADQLIEDKQIDAVVFGRSFINNPDLVHRLFEHLPLNETLGHPLDFKTFYAFETGPSQGYSDYPDVKTALAETKTKAGQSST